MRKLASIQKILKLEPIPNADAIELAMINGWRAVVKKGQFQEGERGVYFEIDAIPPDVEIFKFLWTPKQHPPIPRPDKFRIRTMKLRGCLSQGLLMPLAAMADLIDVDVLATLPEGSDVTELLGVEKYEPPLPFNQGSIIGPFPGFIPKTDEERIQSAPGLLEELAGKPYVITLKYDGTSATFFRDPETHELQICSRNWRITPSENLYGSAAIKYNLDAILNGSNQHLALQAEVIGPRIQKNPSGLKQLEMRIFNVWDWDQAKYLNSDQVAAFCDEHQLPMVDRIESGQAFSYTLGDLLTLAEGTYPGTRNPREGIVIRPAVETYSPTLNGRLSFKVISNAYLLAEKD